MTMQIKIVPSELERLLKKLNPHFKEEKLYGWGWGKFSSPGRDPRLVLPVPNLDFKIRGRYWVYSENGRFVVSSPESYKKEIYVATNIPPTNWGGYRGSDTPEEITMAELERRMG